MLGQAVVEPLDGPRFAFPLSGRVPAAGIGLPARARLIGERRLQGWRSANVGWTERGRNTAQGV